MQLISPPIFAGLYRAGLCRAGLSRAVLISTALPLAVLMVGGTCIYPKFAQAEFTPAQTAVLCNKTAKESCELAEFYASHRGIPRDRIIPVEITSDEACSRLDFVTLVGTIRGELSKRKLSRAIRVLVTTWGIPQRVQGASREQLGMMSESELGTIQQKAGQQILGLSRSALKLSGSDVPSEEADNKLQSGNPMAVVALANERIQKARGILAATENDAAIDPKIQQQMTTIILGAGGLAAVAQVLTATSSDAEMRSKAEAQISALRQQVSEGARALQVLSTSRTPENQKRVLMLTSRIFGLAGVLGLASRELPDDQNASDSALDSDLALLWLDENAVSPVGRLPNPLLFRSQAARQPAPPPRSSPSTPLLVIGRLDGPTPAHVKKLIENSLKAEKEGLMGNAYFDSRGLVGDQSNKLASFDSRIAETAKLFNRATSLPVTLDSTERTFSRKAEASDAAVYVGWYKLRSYEDAFTFVPGAIGFHVASEEALSLHNVTEPGWCKNALERGISATLGPVAEPYLEAFPDPRDFYALLLTGKYSLGEAYALTIPTLSWRMMLIGDPLYNPWKKNPQISVADILDNSSSGVDLAKIPPAPPSNLPWADPEEQLRKTKAERAKLLLEIQRSFEQLERGNMRTASAAP